MSQTTETNDWTITYLAEVKFALATLGADSRLTNDETLRIITNLAWMHPFGAASAIVARR